MVAATLPVPIDSFAFIHTEINIVGIDVLHALFGGCIDPCGGIGDSGILSDVQFLLLGAKDKNIVHPHVGVFVESTGVCRKVVDVGLKQTPTEVRCRTVLEFAECPVQRSAKPDLFQSLRCDRIGSNIYHPKSVACGVAYFEMPDDLLRAVDAVVYRVLRTDAVFEQSDAENQYQEQPREEAEENSPPNFPFRLSF